MMQNENGQQASAVEEQPSDLNEVTDDHASRLNQLKSEYEARLILAHLRTEAVRAGMVDLDGLKLADLSMVRLEADEKLVGAKELMETLRRNKPWLFGSLTSSSSPAVAPPSQPPRLKSALEMTDEEYSAARAVLVSRRF
jgi:hypothetical protein